MAKPCSLAKRKVMAKPCSYSIKKSPFWRFSQLLILKNKKSGSKTTRFELIEVNPQFIVVFGRNFLYHKGMQKEYSILIGGQAGDGIKYVGNTVAKLFNRLGYWIFIYIDYPSLIRGGHNFAIVRAKSEKVLVHKDKIDILIALNQETIKKHIWRLKKGGVIIFDSSSITPTTKSFGVGVGIPLGEIVKNKGLPQISRNIAAFGALGAVLGIEFPIIANIIKGSLRKFELSIPIGRSMNYPISVLDLAMKMN